MVCEVEADADHLAGASHARSPAHLFGDDGQLRRAIANRGSKLLHATALKEGAIVVGNQTRTVSPDAVDQDARFFVPDLPEAHQLHGGGVFCRSASRWQPLVLVSSDL